MFFSEFTLTLPTTTTETEQPKLKTSAETLPDMKEQREIRLGMM